VVVVTVNPLLMHSTVLTCILIAVPRQNNSWDCGVFVCRYAYGLFINRHHRYTRHDGETTFETLITNSNEFAFKVRDIARMRVEFGTLVDRLSDSYKCWKIAESRRVNEESDMKQVLVQVNEESEGAVSYV
jgi:Ulp1 family protease